jgi:Protein of unknown function (DUF2968)
MQLQRYLSTARMIAVRFCLAWTDGLTRRWGDTSDRFSVVSSMKCGEESGEGKMASSKNLRMRILVPFALICASASPQLVRADSGLAARSDEIPASLSWEMPLSSTEATINVQGELQRPAQQVSGNIGELTSLLRESRLKELRTTYNGSYGASVLFLPEDAAYYVALFQQKHFWRVVKTTDRAVADRKFLSFVRETVRLSEAEISSEELAARNALLISAIEQSRQRMQGLQADISNARAQQSIVSTRQNAELDRVRRLAAQVSSDQERLDGLRQTVQTLEMQTEHDLPAYPQSKNGIEITSQ